MAKKSRKQPDPYCKDLREHAGIKVGEPVTYRGCLWIVRRIMQGKDRYGQISDDTPVALDLEWSSGALAGPTKVTVGSHCVQTVEVLDALVAATAEEAADKPAQIHETEAIEDPRRICTSGRVFLRPTYDYAGPDGQNLKRTIIAGIVVGDIGVGGDGEYPEDELWICDVIILRPIQKYRGSKCKGYTVNQMLTGDGLSPEGYTTPLKE